MAINHTINIVNDHISPLKRHHDSIESLTSFAQ
jgi:hypothetical protein